MKPIVSLALGYHSKVGRRKIRPFTTVHLPHGDQWQWANM